MALYYITRNGETYGPYDDAALAEHQSTGDILLTDLACLAGDTAWRPLYHVIKPPVTAGDTLKLARDGNEIAELPDSEVFGKIADGEFLRSDHYWKQGFDTWRPLAAFLNEDAKEHVLIERDGKHFGPYGPGEIQSFLENGNLSCADKAWVPGLKRWCTLQDLFDFLGIELQYYIARDDERFGPYSREQIEEYREQGNLSDDDVVEGPGGFEESIGDFVSEDSINLEGGSTSDPLQEIDDDSLAETDDDDSLSDFGDDDALSDDDSGSFFDTLSDLAGDDDDD